MPVKIERLVAGGDGLGRLEDGRVVFVAGGLPGELVHVELGEQRRDFAKGRVVTIEDRSPDRVLPPCPALAAGCGGCDWQHLAPHAQLGAKVDLVREALRRTAGLPDAPVAAGGSVPAWRYRTSLRAAVGRDGRLGLRRPRSNDVIALSTCPVAHPLLESLLVEVRAPGAAEVVLRVSAATGEATAWSIVGERTRRGSARSSAAAPTSALSVPSWVSIGADATLRETVAGRSFVVSAGAFFQSGPAAAELLVEAVRRAGGEQLAGARRVVDAYGGGGLLAATAVPAPATVTLVEGSDHACADAHRNLDPQRTEIVHGAVEAWTGAPADVVLADPARTGLGPAAAAALARCAAPVLVLVSCDPVAGARDIRLLAEHGYRLERCEVLDLFPQTHHVETVSRLVLADDRSN